MATHEFKFNQADLTTLIDLSENAAPGNSISVSVCGIKEKSGKTEFYLCALAHDASNNVDTSIRPIVGCPFPPEWKEESRWLYVSHNDLLSLPKFKINASSLKTALLTNDHATTGNEKMVSAFFESGMKTGPVISPELETFINFQMKDNAGVNVNSPLKAEVK